MHFIVVSLVAATHKLGAHRASTVGWEEQLNAVVRMLCQNSADGKTSRFKLNGGGCAKIAMCIHWLLILLFIGPLFTHALPMTRSKRIALRYALTSLLFRALL